MKCKKCGEELPENARFCPGCGSPVEGVPAPKKLEEPLAPLAGGAVPLVPVGPPPRAGRPSSRIARSYGSHTGQAGQRPSRYSASSRYGISHIFGHREEEPAAEHEVQQAQEQAVEPVAQPRREEAAEKNVRHVTEQEAEATPSAAAESGPVEAVEQADAPQEPEAVAEPETEAVADAAAEAKPEADAAPEPAEPAAEKPVEDAADAAPEPAEEPVPEPVVEAPAPEPRHAAHAAPQPAAEDVANEEDSEYEDLDAEKTGRLRPIPASEPEPQPQPEPSAPAGPSPAERAQEFAARAKEVAGNVKDAVVDFGHSVAERFESLGPDKVPVIALALVILAVVGVALAYISTGWFSPFADRTAETPQFEEPSDGSIEPIQPEVAEEEPEDEGPIEGGPEVRDTLQAYSWTELSQISALIAAAPSDEEGIDIARRYNLCAESGSIDANNVKNLELSSGAVVPVAIGGFRHDAKSDGTGVSGITFITRASVGNQAVDPSGIATAWEETPLRSWLNQSLMAEIPAELAELVVPVNKTTNLPMAYGSGQSVTSEYLWIPSYSEVVGPLDSSNRRYGIYQSEGEQYQLYTDSGVTSVGDNATLALGEYWWTRSPDVVTDYWYLVVSPEGGTPYGHRTGTPDAIILGFCL